MKIDLDRGLTTEEVVELTRKGLSNVSVKNQSKSIKQIVIENVFTYFNLIFAIFALMLILVRSYINMTFLPIIFINTLIGIVQEIRSKSVLDQLSVLNQPRTRVIRDGQLQDVPSEELVQGDICIFGAGNQICADAKICEGTVRVNEALVTGEADEIKKSAGDVLLSGSFVVSGECKVVLENVGYESFAAKLMLEAKSSRKRQHTEMIDSLNKLVKVIGIVIIPLGILMFCEHRFFIHSSVQESVVAIIASLVGMIPEGLYLLASVALVVSVMRLGKKRVIVHEMQCVETLARVDVLCVDKTGTITKNCMSVEEIELLHSNVKQHTEKILAAFVACLDDDNATMHAMKEYFSKDDSAQNNHGLYPLEVCQFSSEYKYSGVRFENAAYVLGAPENLLLDQYSMYQDCIESKAKMGARVLVFGLMQDADMGNVLRKPVIPLAMISLSNPLRDQAESTFQYFQEQGVEVKVISGDNPITVSNVAKKAGIQNADLYIDARELNSEEIQAAATKYTVFGRVQPEQKRKLIEALKDAGRTVAMTGDGVNDVLALKKADCSIAMASGSDAACNAAQIVLLDSNFEAMPNVVLEGRRVINNIQRAASLFLVKNIFSILLTFFTMFMICQYPLYPTQLSLLGAFTIGAPAFLLALQPNKSIIRGHFLTNVTIKALPSAITDFLAAATITLYGRMNGIELEQISTMTILCLLAVGIATLIRVCKPFDWRRVVICVSMITGIVFSLLFLRPVFAIYALTITQIKITAVIMVVSFAIFILMCYFVEWLCKRRR